MGEMGRDKTSGRARGSKLTMAHLDRVVVEHCAFVSITPWKILTLRCVASRDIASAYLITFAFPRLI